MIVSCPSCEARFQMPDEHVVRPGVRFRCTACRFVFSLSEIPQAATQPIMPAPDRLLRPDPAASALPFGSGFGGAPAAAASARPPQGLTGPAPGRSSPPSADGSGPSSYPRGGTEPAGLPNQQLRGRDPSGSGFGPAPQPGGGPLRAGPAPVPPSTGESRKAGVSLGPDQSVLPTGFHRGFDSGSLDAAGHRGPMSPTSRTSDVPSSGGRPNFDSIHGAPAPVVGAPSTVTSRPSAPSTSPGTSPSTAPFGAPFSGSRSAPASASFRPAPAAAPRSAPTTSPFDSAFTAPSTSPLAAPTHARSQPARPFESAFPSSEPAPREVAAREPARASAPSSSMSSAPSTSMSAAPSSSTSSGASASRLPDRPFSVSSSIDSALPVSAASSEFRVVESAVEADPLPDGQGIDPMVEFNDLFQEIRRAEKGDSKRASERYVADGLFGDPESSSAPLAPHTTEDTVPRATLADLQRAQTPPGVAVDPKVLDQAKAGGPTGEGPARVPVTGLFSASELSGAAPSGTNDDSMLLQLALTQSGLREPSGNTASVKKASVIDMDASGDSSTRPSLFPRGGAVLAGVLVVLACVIGTALYTASRNSWVLDLADPAQMLGVAFKGVEYQPRHTRVITIEAGVETELEATELGSALDARPERGLSAAAGDGGVYVSAAGHTFAVVTGRVNNATDNTYRGMLVEVTLRDASGAVVHTRQVPAGAPLEQPALEAATDGDLTASYAALSETVASVRLEPGQETVFTGAFLLSEGEITDGLSYGAQVVAAERAVPMTWRAVTFSPDQVTVVDQGPAQAGE